METGCLLTASRFGFGCAMDVCIITFNSFRPLGKVCRVLEQGGHEERKMKSEDLDCSIARFPCWCAHHLHLMCVALLTTSHPFTSCPATPIHVYSQQIPFSRSSRVSRSPETRCAALSRSSLPWFLRPGAVPVAESGMVRCTGAATGNAVFVDHRSWQTPIRLSWGCRGGTWVCRRCCFVAGQSATGESPVSSCQVVGCCLGLETLRDRTCGVVWWGNFGAFLILT